MNIKGTLRTFMAKCFAAVTFVGFLVIGCINDIPTNGFGYYFGLWGCWMVCATIAILLYNPKLLLRHIYAAVAVYIAITRRDPKKYARIHNEYRFAQDNIEFYFHMLDLYDETVN